LTNILHRKICKIARNCSDFLRILCYKFRATFVFFERNFLGGLAALSVVWQAVALATLTAQLCLQYSSAGWTASKWSECHRL